MPAYYTINSELNIVNEVYEGIVTFSEVEDHWKKLVTDPKALEIRRSLADTREADTTNFKGDDMAVLIKSILVPILKGRSWKTATLVKSPLHIGVTRQFQVYSEGCVNNAIFFDYDTALQWLLQ